MLSFQSDGMAMPSIDTSKISRWLRQTASCYGKRVGEVAYCFCNDETILEANRQFLDHDYYTDILTFDETEDDVINGNILISLDTVMTNAESLSLSYDEELLRVIVHGILHLCGIKDKTPEERGVMEEAENKALRLYNEI